MQKLGYIPARTAGRAGTKIHLNLIGNFADSRKSIHHLDITSLGKPLLSFWPITKDDGASKRHTIVCDYRRGVVTNGCRVSDSFLANCPSVPMPQLQVTTPCNGDAAGAHQRGQKDGLRLSSPFFREDLGELPVLSFCATIKHSCVTHFYLQ